MLRKNISSKNAVGKWRKIGSQKCIGSKFYATGASERVSRVQRPPNTVQVILGMAFAGKIVHTHNNKTKSD